MRLILLPDRLRCRAMKDLTQGSIISHILQMAAVMVIGMVGQTLYYLVDLYFVSGLGPQAIAGVSAAGNITFVILALTPAMACGPRPDTK